MSHARVLCEGKWISSAGARYRRCTKDGSCVTHRRCQGGYTAAGYATPDVRAVAASTFLRRLPAAAFGHLIRRLQRHLQATGIDSAAAGEIEGGAVVDRCTHDGQTQRDIDRCAEAFVLEDR